MKVRLVGIGVLVGIVVGLFLSPVFWRGVGRALAQQQTRNQEIITVAKIAMAGKTVCLVGEDKCASAATNMLVFLGARYAPRKEADFLITAQTVKRLGFRDIDFRARDGRLLYRVSTSATDIAEEKALMWAWSMAVNKKT